MRPSGGAGRGKDMANILEAEAGREKSDSADRGGEEDASRTAGGSPGGRVGKPPISALKLKPSKPKLTDLDLSNQTDSETDEYQQSNHE